MSSLEHTPTPWEVSDGIIWIADAEQVCCGRSHGECCGEPEIRWHQAQIAESSPNDAAFIVKAVNSYEASQALIAKLTEALERAAEQLSRAHDDAFKQCAGHGLVTSDGREFSCLELNKCDDAARESRAALSLAKSETPQ